MKFIKNNKGQTSIELFILILAVVIGGVMVASNAPILGFNTTGIQDSKEVTFSGFTYRGGSPVPSSESNNNTEDSAPADSVTVTVIPSGEGTIKPDDKDEHTGGHGPPVPTGGNTIKPDDKDEHGLNTGVSTPAATATIHTDDHTNLPAGTHLNLELNGNTWTYVKSDVIPGGDLLFGYVTREVHSGDTVGYNIKGKVTRATITVNRNSTLSLGNLTENITVDSLVLNTTRNRNIVRLDVQRVETLRILGENGDLNFKTFGTRIHTILIESITNGTVLLENISHADTVRIDKMHNNSELIIKNSYVPSSMHVNEMLPNSKLRIDDVDIQLLTVSKMHNNSNLIIRNSNITRYEKRGMINGSITYINSYVNGTWYNNHTE